MTEDNREYILKLFKIVSTDSVLVVDFKGEIKRLYCPFRVICLVDLAPLKQGLEYSVEAVKMTLKLQDVFLINSKGYLVQYFQIMGQ